MCSRGVRCARVSRGINDKTRIRHARISFVRHREPLGERELGSGVVNRGQFVCEIIAQAASARGDRATIRRDYVFSEPFQADNTILSRRGRLVAS